MPDDDLPVLHMPLDELRRRYEALGPVEEMPGERTMLGRCYTWESFLSYGPAVAQNIRDLSSSIIPRTPTAHALAQLIRDAYL